VQAGNLDAVEFWESSYARFRKAMPRPGRAGVGPHPHLGSNLWGGALFCWRPTSKSTSAPGNRFGLQDALRAIARASGGYRRQWSIDRVLQTGDEATGVHALTDLYVKMRDQPAAPDLGRAVAAGWYRHLGRFGNDWTKAVRAPRCALP